LDADDARTNSYLGNARQILYICQRIRNVEGSAAVSGGSFCRTEWTSGSNKVSKDELRSVRNSRTKYCCTRRRVDSFRLFYPLDTRHSRGRHTNWYGDDIPIGNRNFIRKEILYM